MPKLRFIGTYNGGRTSIAMGEYVFEGRKPTMVDETTDMGRRLMGNPEFSADPLDHDGNGESGGSLPDAPPTLTNVNKAGLLQIAANEGVEATEDMTNAEIKAAIEAAR